MNRKVVGIVLLAAALAGGCRDARNHLKTRRAAVDLLRSISDMEKQLAGEEDSLRYLDALGQQVVNQRAVIESAGRRLASLQSEIEKHSDVENPTINELRYEELDVHKMLDQVKKILDEHNKGIKRAKEQFTI